MYVVVGFCSDLAMDVTAGPLQCVLMQLHGSAFSDPFVEEVEFFLGRCSKFCCLILRT